MVGLLFPGQGSQFVGMGRDLADTYPEARRTFEEADETLGFALSKLAWEGPEPDLTATSVAQPALLTHSIAVYRIIHDRLGDVAFGAGHSLGEFTAWVAAGSLSFRDGLHTVRLRGELMQRSGEERPGSMAALLGIPEENVEQVCRDASTADEVCVPANYNSPGQIVISGDVAAVDRAMDIAKSAGAKRAMRLKVSGAFHSPLMHSARHALGVQLDAVDFRAPAFPIISNVTAQPVSDPADARRLMLEQLTGPVRWTASIRTMVASGVQSFYEIGPGDVLSGLVRRIEKGVVAQHVGTAAEVGKVMA